MGSCELGLSLGQEAVAGAFSLRGDLLPAKFPGGTEQSPQEHGYIGVSTFSQDWTVNVPQMFEVQFLFPLASFRRKMGSALPLPLKGQWGEEASLSSWTLVVYP